MELNRRPRRQGPHGAAAPPLNSGAPLARFAAPSGVPPKAQVGGSTWHRRSIWAHPSRGARPRIEPRRRPQWQGPRGTGAQFWRARRAVRSPAGSSAEGR
eukprot:7640142-Pyramimonas_sp.AAC.1